MVLRRAAIAGGIALAIALFAVTSAQASDPDGVELRPVGPSGAPLRFAYPMFVSSPPGDRARLFVVEIEGRIQIARDDARLAQPFLDIVSRVRSAGDGERGMQSMAFAPDYATSGRFYVFYTAVDDDGPGPHELGDVVVDEYTRSASDPDVADPASRRELLRIPHSAANHNGGQLQFGPDGLLYISVGDNANGANSQTTTNLLGKLLRIDPRQPVTSQVPADNPFGNEVWAYGLRNPFRFSFDRETGDLTIGDVGQSAVEEIDFVARSAGGGRAANFGWNLCEGRRSYPIGTLPCALAPTDHVPPVLEQQHVMTPCNSITGGVVVRDRALPQLYGRYIYGDFCRRYVRTAVLETPDAIDDRDLALGVSGNWVAFSETAGGCVYAVDLYGPIYRLAPTAGGPACPDPPGSSPPGGSVQPPSVPPPSVPPPEGSSGKLPDLSAPRLSLSGASTQAPFEQDGKLVVLARCPDEDCSLFGYGYVSVPGASALFRLGKANKSGRAGQRKTLELQLPRRGRSDIKAALKRKRKLTARVTVRAKDASLNKRLVKRTIRLKLR